MKLRRLETKDSDKMLEWMQDSDINRFFRFDTNNIKKEQVIDFINSSLIDNSNLHLAIVDDTDEYMGTISLKNIDCVDGNAEYAISLRKMAIGTDIAQKATDTILYIAYFELGLNKVYLNVLSHNLRAIRFYEKYGFDFEGEFKEHVKIGGDYQNLKWFGMLKTMFLARVSKNLDRIAGRYARNILGKERT